MMMRSSVVLPQPDCAHDADHRAARDRQVDVAQHRPGGVVAEGNVLDFNDLRLLHGVILSSMGEALKDRGAREALRRNRRRWRGVDLEVAAGEAFGLVGANGAGKTTLIKCLLDLVRARRGRDRDLRHRRAATPRRGAGSPTCPSASTRRTTCAAREFLAMMLRARRRALRRSARPGACSTSCELERDALERPVRALSKGMTQKLGLAGCFLAARAISTCSTSR